MRQRVGLERLLCDVHICERLDDDRVQLLVRDTHALAQSLVQLLRRLLPRHEGTGMLRAHTVRTRAFLRGDGAHLQLQLQVQDFSLSLDCNVLVFRGAHFCAVRLRVRLVQQVVRLVHEVTGATRRV